MPLSRIALHGRLPMLAPEGEGGGGGGGNDGGNQDGAGGNGSGAGTNGGNAGAFTAITTQEAFDAAIRGRLDRQERALTTQITERVKAELQAEREGADRQAQADRQRQQEIDRGEFDAARTSLEGERDAAKGEADGLRAENDRLEAAMKDGIAAGWKDLPEAVRKIGEKQFGEDDVLGRFGFLNDPDTAALVASLTGAGGGRGNGPDPKSNGNGGIEIKSLVPGRSMLG